MPRLPFSPPGEKVRKARMRGPSAREAAPSSALSGTFSQRGGAKEHTGRAGC